MHTDAIRTAARVLPPDQRKHLPQILARITACHLDGPPAVL
ncbi:hypothetical protein [Actinocrispum wychmicini]|nr:hypothetical protein [Actinocrispum wychmicini]